MQNKMLPSFISLMYVYIAYINSEECMLNFAS